ncbi:tRNA lysidine(34) synthetase TilS [Macrococcus equipercicus]|uniref:tRNA(Ile)-lysidine synthase n=1 Tax=Macrococcus equipercicus TaxID=69967 RepID=A0ABQ6R673_9STAP|nr:tRNA lysidine(34) synthetase TilS [Macrococcus equipercicus]KAA1036168.1 tRNA lysidine(34) synthetase TilS [Macrococcus equipercicus]
MNWCWTAGQRAAVAVSGGVDSMVLLDKVRESGRCSALVILHVNHGLRPESKDEQQLIEEYAHQYGIPCFTATIPAGYFKEGQSIQRAARDYRYRFFDQVMKQQQLDVLLTAHHQDDQLETIMFRLLTRRFYTQRLSIADTERESYVICRPLIDVKKHELIDYAVTHRVPYMEDASNNSTKYARNAIRHQLLPVIDSISQLSSESLLDLAVWQEEVLELVTAGVNEFKGRVDQTPSGYRWDRALFNMENKLVRRALLIQLLEEATGDHVALAHSYLDEIVRVSASDTAQASYQVTSKWHIEIAYDKLMLQCKQPVDDYMEIQSPGKYQFNGFEIELTAPVDKIIIVRLPRPRDKIKIGKHHQKINRIMINNKVPAAVRNRLPIVEIDGTIVAVGAFKRASHPINDILTIKGEEQHA